MSQKKWLTEYAIGGKVVVQVDTDTISFRFGEGPVQSFNSSQSYDLRMALECGCSSYYADKILGWAKEQGFPLKPIQYMEDTW